MKHLETVRHSMNRRPFGDQRAARSWTRDELLLSGMDLIKEGEQRKRAARAMKPGKKYTNRETMAFVQDTHD